MYHVSAQGVDELMINVRYYFVSVQNRSCCSCIMYRLSSQLIEISVLVSMPRCHSLALTKSNKYILNTKPNRRNYSLDTKITGTPICLSFKVFLSLHFSLSISLCVSFSPPPPPPPTLSQFALSLSSTKLGLYPVVILSAFSSLSNGRLFKARLQAEICIHKY